MTALALQYKYYSKTFHLFISKVINIKKTLDTT